MATAVGRAWTLQDTGNGRGDMLSQSGGIDPQADWAARSAGALYAENFDYATKQDLLDAAASYNPTYIDHMELSTEHALSGKVFRLWRWDTDTSPSYRWGFNVDGSPGPGQGVVQPKFYYQLIIWTDEFFRWAHKTGGTVTAGNPKAFIIDQHNQSTNIGEVVCQDRFMVGHPAFYRVRSNANFANNEIAQASPGHSDNFRFTPGVDNGGPETTMAEYLQKYGVAWKGMSCSGGDGTQDGIQGVFIDSVIQHPDPNAAQGGITWNFGGYTVLEVEVDYPNDSFRVWAAHYGEAPKLICDSSIDTYGSADLNPGREQATGEAGWSGIQLTHFLTGGQAEPGVRPNMYIDYVESITSLSPIDFPGGLPVDVGTPAYIQGMADYSVQRLNTASGNDTLLQAYQAAGIPNQFPGAGNDIDNIQRAWGGGIGNPERRKIHFQGGGHGNSAHNGVLSYDFNGDTLPTGFVIEPNSHTLTTDEVTANTRTFTDGRPNSYHTYDQIGLVNDVLYRFAGAIWNPGGGGQPFCDSYEFATQSWNTASLGTQIPDMPGGALRSVGMGMVSDSVTGKILYLPRGGGQGHFYRVATNDWSTVTNPLNYGQTASHFTAHHDERRRSGRTRVFVVPVVNSNILEVDWENEQLFDGGLWSPSDTAVQNYISMTSLYDPHPTDPNLDRLWFTGVQADLATSMPMEIYAMNLSTYTVTTTPLTGDQLNWSSSYGNASVRGTYKRSAIFQGWGVIALCEATDHAYVVKLPLWGS